MVRTEHEMVGIYGKVLLTTNPAPAGFLSRYILCVTPVLLVVISLLVLEIMRIFVSSFLPSWGKTLALLVPDLSVMMEIVVLCISPVGILLFFIYIGDVVHRPEIWIGSALTLVLSILGALFFLQGADIPLLSSSFLQTLLHWVAYLILPASVMAAVFILAGIEIFRRSFVYSITSDVVIINGGIWKQVENVIPLHTVKRVVVVQGRLERYFNTGTVLPQGIVLGNRDLDLRKYPAGGGGLHAGAYRDHMVSWQAGSHDPYISLFGVHDPESVRLTIEKAIDLLSDKREE
jgi:membrane protein YdbS with pleckstrin-like domain